MFYVIFVTHKNDDSTDTQSVYTPQVCHPHLVCVRPVLVYKKYDDDLSGTSLTLVRTCNIFMNIETFFTWSTDPPRST